MCTVVYNSRVQECIILYISYIVYSTCVQACSGHVHMSIISGRRWVFTYV